jgi:hypothetical protein
LAASTGCASTLLDQHIEQKAQGWSVTLEKVTDGPDDYARGDNVHFVPPDGMRYLWFKIRIRNEESQARTFNYQGCDVDLGDQAFSPAIVDRDMIINATADDTEQFGSGEENTRKLAFAYPEGHLPTRLACGDVVIGLEALASAKGN